MELAILAFIAVLLLVFMQTAKVISEYVISINRELGEAKSTLEKMKFVNEEQNVSLRRTDEHLNEINAKLDKIEYLLEKADTERGWFYKDVHRMDLTKRRMDHKHLEREILNDLRNDFQEAGLREEADQIDRQLAGLKGPNQM